MIKIKKNKVNVEFSKTVQGRVAITAKENKIIFRDVLGVFKVGDNLSPESILEKPMVEMEFFRTDSIDVLIEQLLRVRNNIAPKPPTVTFSKEDANRLAEAC